MKKFGSSKDNDNATAKLVNKMADNIDKTLIEATGGSDSILDNNDIPVEIQAKPHTTEQIREQENIIREQRMREVQKNPNGNTLFPPSDPNDFSPDIQTFGRKPEGLSSASLSKPQTIDFSGRGIDGTESARAATKIDLLKLAGEVDESMIMHMPFIKATANIVPGILFLKPKDPTVRFRWVNYKNWEGGNYQKFRALGFVNASPDDVDQEKTPVGDNCVQGTEIKWYDVMLMKINVWTLMGLYKANIMSSLEKVGRFQQNAKSHAQEEFNNLLNNSLVEAGKYQGQAMISAYKRLQSEAGKKLVQFYVPGLDNKSDKDYQADLEEFSQDGDSSFAQATEFPGGVTDASYRGIGAPTQGYTHG